MKLIDQDYDRVFLLFLSGLFSAPPILSLLPFGWPGNLIALCVLFAVGVLTIFLPNWFPQKIRKILMKPLTWTWVFLLLVGTLWSWFLMFFVASAFPDYYFVEKIGTLKLEHGYSLVLYDDTDVNDLLAALHGPDGREYQRENIGSTEFGSPHLVARKTADGTLGWVTRDSDPDRMLFLIDYSTGDYHSDYDGWHREHWDVLNAGNDEEYLKRINADGGNRRF
ncbi:MAG TPA: hypothetical protein VG733_15925 [Chthoniobacteraceae bacterium]|nr:hypothetical protein [Chthoniobacteraceae bacterium]